MLKSHVIVWRRCPALFSVQVRSSHIFMLSSYTLGISSCILATALFASLPFHLYFCYISWPSFTSLHLLWPSLPLALPSLYKYLARSTEIRSGVLPSFSSPSISLSCPKSSSSIPILSLVSLPFPLSPLSPYNHPVQPHKPSPQSLTLAGTCSCGLPQLVAEQCIPMTDKLQDKH